MKNGIEARTVGGDCRDWFFDRNGDKIGWCKLAEVEEMLVTEDCRGGCMSR